MQGKTGKINRTKIHVLKILTQKHGDWQTKKAIQLKSGVKYKLN